MVDFEHTKHLFLVFLVLTSGKCSWDSDKIMIDEMQKHAYVFEVEQ